MSGENFLMNFGKTLAIADFMKVWDHYDKDGSGHLEEGDFAEFVRDLLQQTGMPSDGDSVETYRVALMDTFDVDEDGRIGLGELMHVLPVEENFLLATGEGGLGRAEVDEIFGHYDRDGNGVIEGAELAGLVHDLMRTRDADAEPGAEAVREYCEMVKRATGAADGKVSREALAALFTD